MKFHIVTALCTIATALISTAEVPSLINYQGRLTNANGDPVTGSKNFAISIYDAVTGGTLLYTETIGAVTLDDNGVYSFQFGGSGTSNTLVTETVATSDGAATTFQKVLDNSPVVANSVSVTDGTYTWSQTAGSSNEDQFGVAYSTSLRRVTANYYNGAPAIGRTITTTYRYGTSGITGALSNGSEHWMAISVDGTTQGTRQRVLAVPFASKAALADVALLAENVLPRSDVENMIVGFEQLTPNLPHFTYLNGYGYPGYSTYGNGMISKISPSIQKIESISWTCENKTMNGYQGRFYPTMTKGKTVVEFCRRDGSGNISVIDSRTTLGTSKSESFGPFILNHPEFEYFLRVYVDHESSDGFVEITGYDNSTRFPTTIVANIKNIKMITDSF
jgi:hypothetical protein